MNYQPQVSDTTNGPITHVYIPTIENEAGGGWFVKMDPGPPQPILHGGWVMESSAPSQQPIQSVQFAEINNSPHPMLVHLSLIPLAFISQ